MDKPAKDGKGENSLCPKEDAGYSDEMRADVRARFADLVYDAYESHQRELPQKDPVLH